MSTLEPADHERTGEPEASADTQYVPYGPPMHDLRIGYGDRLVHHPAPVDAGARHPTMKVIRNLLWFVVILAFAWTAWAAGSFYDLTLGLRDGDAVALERRIDWSSVRQALREDLQAGAVAPSGDRTIDALVSPAAIANLLRTVKLDDNGWDVGAPTGGAPFDWHRIRYAFFTGGPVAYRVDLTPGGSAFRGPLVLLFRWAGDWRLTRIFLPAPKSPLAARPQRPATLAAATPATGAAAPEPPRAAPAATPPGAEQAVLYEETAEDKASKRYQGSVIWRTEAAAAAGLPGFTVTAHASIPERPLDMTMTIRRNPDPGLPASHVIEINFDLPANSATRGIGDMTGITMMKSEEEAPGQRLAGSHVKVRDGFFLLGLSAIAADVHHNTELLLDQPWLGLPIRYNNGGRAVLVIEKGETGRKSLAEALMRWQETTSERGK